MSGSLNPAKVPLFVAPLLPMAERWGIGDDIERAQAVDSATREEIEALVACLDIVDDDAVFEWLAGPESHNPDPSAEYLAVTNLTMAIDLARLRMKTGR